MGQVGRGLGRRLWSQRYSAVGVRIGLGCAVMAGVCLSQVEVGSGVSGADSTFIPGTASAGAQAISLAPTTGGLNYAIVLATSLAQYENNQGQALSQTIDLGAIGTSLEAEGCNNAPPTLPKKDVPPPVQAESTNGNQTVTDTITPETTTSGVGAGNEVATATTQPAGTATTTTAGINLPGGLITVGAMTSTSHVAIVNGNTRTATATADIAALSLAKGLIQLGGLQWTATQTSGASTASSGTFSLGSLKVGGVTVPLSVGQSPQSLLNIINTVGSPLGINIQWPAMSTLPDGTVTISPLIIGLDNNVLGQEVIGANLGTVQPVRSALVNAVLEADCNLAAEITVSDIGLGVLAGGGNLNLELGGANALTTDVASVSPFSSLTGGLGATPLPSDLSGTTLPTTSTFTPGTPGTPGTAGTSPVKASTGAKPKLAVETTSFCMSLSTAGGGCNKLNAAVPIGLIVLAVLLGLAAWDYLRQRRRGQLNGTEATG